MGNQAFLKWTKEYQEAARLGTDHAWPTETLIRIFKGEFVPGMSRDHRGKKVLDVSCGNGSDMVLFGTLGMALFGTEVTPELCSAASEKLAGYGYKADIKVATNTRLPFPDRTFDYLVSWNVLHYENTEADIQAAIAEYRRVLKKGGRMFVCTAGPDHEILEGAKTLGNHRYEIRKKDDFRVGQVFFYFEARNYIRFYFEPHFKDVLIGEVRDDLFGRMINFYIITGVRG